MSSGASEQHEDNGCSTLGCALFAASGAVTRRAGSNGKCIWTLTMALATLSALVHLRRVPKPLIVIALGLVGVVLSAAP